MQANSGLTGLPSRFYSISLSISFVSLFLLPGVPNPHVPYSGTCKPHQAWTLIDDVAPKWDPNMLGKSVSQRQWMTLRTVSSGDSRTAAQINSRVVVIVHT